ncbi:MAG: ABC transporter ATP-binding protein [Azoarcus sp.]|jgi:NitT/TauT family transport system ATP-binding protein|nr:ABC transporter ATP-binding protein [Azoarcus sp.]
MPRTNVVSIPLAPHAFVREQRAPHEDLAAPRTNALIRASGVEMRFPSAKGEAARILAGIELDIHDGEFHVLLGPSGCGKSTLLNIIAGLTRPTAGTVTMHGKTIHKPGRDRGVVFQHAEAAIFPWLTVLENVEFGPRMAGVAKRERRERARKYIERVGLSGHEGKFPHELSGGMKQRTQIARLLANDSSVLIMDEPFGALDAHTRRVMQNELTRLWRETGKTVLFVTHDIQEAILIGQHIHIMSKAPDTRICQRYDVALPWPRTETHPGFVDLLARIQRHFDFGSEL